MQPPLSFIDICIIQQQLTKLTAEAIAALILKPVNVVADKITELTATKQYGISVAQKLQNKEAKKLAKKPGEKSLKAKNKELEKQAMATAKFQAKAPPRFKRIEPGFATRQLDLSQKISVRLNAKTTIFVNPGADIEKIKKLYAKQ